MGEVVLVAEIEAQEGVEASPGRSVLWGAVTWETPEIPGVLCGDSEIFTEVPLAHHVSGVAQTSQFLGQSAQVQPQSCRLEGQRDSLTRNILEHFCLNNITALI